MNLRGMSKIKGESIIDLQVLKNMKMVTESEDGVFFKVKYQVAFLLPSPERTSVQDRNN